MGKKRKKGQIPDEDVPSAKEHRSVVKPSEGRHYEYKNELEWDNQQSVPYPYTRERSSSSALASTHALASLAISMRQI
jgi:hypothetical protein